MIYHQSYFISELSDENTTPYYITQPFSRSCNSSHHHGASVGSYWEWLSSTYHGRNWEIWEELFRERKRGKILKILSIIFFFLYLFYHSYFCFSIYFDIEKMSNTKGERKETSKKIDNWSFCQQKKNCLS